MKATKKLGFVCVLALAAVAVGGSASASPAVRSATISGLSCLASQGTVAIREGNKLKIEYADFLAQGSGMAQRDTCAAMIQLRVPAGYRAKVVAVTYAQDIQLDAGASRVLVTDLRLQGSHSKRKETVLQGPLAHHARRTLHRLEPSEQLVASCGRNEVIIFQPSARIEGSHRSGGFVEVHAAELQLELVPCH